MNDYRFYQVTVGCDNSCQERSYKVIALDPSAAVKIALNLAKKDSWPAYAFLAAVNIALADKRVKN